MEKTPSIDAFNLLRGLTAGEAALMTSRIETSARIRFMVAQALAQGRISFHYQPVVRAAHPGVPAFYEMLARLTLPNGQVLPAGAFLPCVEDGPLGRKIDRLGLAHALEALTETPSLRLSVNMSPLSMGDAPWLEILSAAAERDRSVTGRLILEITETAALAHSDQTADFMDHVRGFGCAFALDDFGAGATGFRHFLDFRFDMVKIDGCFVQGIHSAPDAQVLVECLMAVARHFEMFTIAERVEAQADADWLAAAGVDCLQGYLFGKPAAAPMTPEAPAASAPSAKAG